MKKIILLGLCILLLVGCQNEQVATTSDTDSIFYCSGRFPVHPEDPVGTYTQPVIPDEETAIEVATAIMQSIQRKGYGKEYVIQSVFFDTVDEIWIVTFALPQYDVTALMDGGGYSIAMRKSNAEVVRIWAGE